MNIKELYEGNEFYNAAFEKMQKPRFENEADLPEYITHTCAPEVMEHDLVKDWLAKNYLLCTYFTKDGKILMGQIGGLVLKEPNLQTSLLSIAQSNLDRTFFGFGVVEKLLEDNTPFEKIQGILFKMLGTEFENQNGIFVVNGNYDFANCDFVALAARKNPQDIIITNNYLMLAGAGVTVVSMRQLKPTERYIFNFPTNNEIFEQLKLIPLESVEKRLDVIRALEDKIVPDGFIAGFHTKYVGKEVYVTPIIDSNEAKKHADFLHENKLNPKKSKITKLAQHTSDGKCFFSLNSIFE